MAQRIALKRAFLGTGVFVGVAVSGWYLCTLHATKPAAGGAPPDSLPTQLINIGLICFAAIVQFRLLGRLVSWLLARGQETPGGGQ